MLQRVLQQMVKVFVPSVLKEGLEYQQNGNVLSVKFSEGLIKARVKGNSGQIYNVHADLKLWPTLPSLCSCKDKNCKHIVASFFALQIQYQLPRPDLPLFDLNITKRLPTDVLRQESEQEQDLLDTNSFSWFSNLANDGNDFLSYRLGIIVQGRKVDLLPVIINYVNLTAAIDTFTQDFIPLVLPDGTKIKITRERIQPLMDFIRQYKVKLPADNAAKIKINRYQATILPLVEKFLVVKSIGYTAYKQNLQLLADAQAIPQSILPQGLQINLRDYQKQGVNWLQLLRKTNFHGILGDDMGLGKTIQTLTHLLIEKEQERLQKPSLIIVPTSLIYNWFIEAQRFTPDLKVTVFHGSERQIKNFIDYDLVITTYGIIKQDRFRLCKIKFYYLILDEAQLIKNHNSQITQIITQIQARHRLCLSGTPIENNLIELWSLFNFLMPGFLGDLGQFKKFIQVPIEKYNDRERQNLLTKNIQPFLLRRTKSEVAQDLSAKTEMFRYVELEGPQRDLYETVRVSMLAKINEAFVNYHDGKGHIIFLDALLKLRQICCDPRLLKLSAASIAYSSSAKLKELSGLLAILLSEKRRVLIFSQFRSMLELIAKDLDQNNYSYLKLTGETTNRQQLIDEFQQGSCDIFLISLRAGGKGLNLTGADTVIHYDPWWNPAVEDQATDRAHRIGQKNPVFVYKFISVGTIEEMMLTLQQKKRKLFNTILSTDNSGLQSLSLEDIKQFFLPLS